MTYSADIDTLYAVFANREILHFDGRHNPLSKWRKRTGGYGYNSGQVDDATGMRRFASTDRKDMGILYVVTATALSALASLTASTSYLYAALDFGFGLARASRLDVRVDLDDRGVAAHALAIELEAGRCVYAARKAYVYRGVEGDRGLTCYFGSKKSTSFVRVYDKWEESRHEKPVTRVEVQLRHARAAQAWEALRAGDNEIEWSANIRSIISAHISRFNVRHLDQILEAGAPFVFERDTTSVTDIRCWLKAQVVPSLVRDARANFPYAPLLEWLVAEVERQTLLT